MVFRIGVQNGEINLGERKRNDSAKSERKVKM